MAQKKQIIVIKKVYVNKGGHHGGSWKVALADFMTAMMAFFLVMWLIGQSEETKKAISDYFSAPSMIEYNYENYGAEITLEKLFMDFVSEPLKAVQSFFEPADKTPNVMDMGSQKVIAAFMADKLADLSKNVNISKDVIEFDIPDTYLFEQGSSKPKANFVAVMEKLTAITSGLKDSDVKVESIIFVQTVEDQTQATAEKVAQGRLDLIKNKIAATFEHPSNKIAGSIEVKDKKGEFNLEKLIGYIHISIKPKENAAAKKPVVLEKTDNDLNKPVFESFAKDALVDKPQLKGNHSIKKQVESINEQAQRKVSGEKATGTTEERDINLSNPVDIEVNKINQESEPTSQ